MNRQTAIALINQGHQKPMLHGGNTSFANINAAKDVWWFDISLQRVAQPTAGLFVHLLPFDQRCATLHHLKIPTSYFQENLPKLVVRNDRMAISLELSADSRNLFQDMRPGSAGVGFAQFQC
jgi:hypothetical protein